MTEGNGAEQRRHVRCTVAPSCIVFFGHHKCASRFFRLEVFRRVAEMTSARIRGYEIRNPPFHILNPEDLDLCNIDFSGIGKNGRDIFLFSNSTERSLDRIRRATSDWRGFRVLRDPRQVLVSNYFHHVGDHLTEASGWVWDQLLHDKPILRGLSKEEGLLYELDNISKQMIEKQLLAKFNTDRILTIKLEDFDQDPRQHLHELSDFLQIPEVTGIDFNRRFANPNSGPWQHHLTSRLREVFKARYGEALIELGYAKDLDW